MHLIISTVNYAVSWMFILQDTNDEKINVAVKLPNKKTPGAKPPAKPAKEKVVKPKKEVIKLGKLVKPDPTAKAKVAGNQPGVVRGITYYKAAKTDEDEHRGGESCRLAETCALSQKALWDNTLFHTPSEFTFLSVCDHLCVIHCGCWKWSKLVSLLDQDQPGALLWYGLSLIDWRTNKFK